MTETQLWHLAEYTRVAYAVPYPLWILVMQFGYRHGYVDALERK